ncbi:N-acetyltransferase family protein [Photobacterium satsumensis]|uniref:GNAT family N-acetyltransferase n=1 Tax=Photobacterium satsumensis TaxID=2910239 RepID=UPI003D120891
MDLKITTQYIDTESHEQSDQLEALFAEYIATLSVSIEPHVVTQLFQLPYFHGFICFVDNEPAAFAVCFESYSTYKAKKILNIHDFMVSAHFRGQGVGKALLNGIEQYCIANEYLKITLEVDDDNSVAKKLYSACGYEDHQVMLKRLFHWQKYLC